MRKMRFAVALLLGAVAAGPAGAINIVLDYSYDTQGFFNNANAKATLEKAASDLSTILTDSFSSISTPPDFVGQFSTQRWEWTMRFDHPGNNAAPEIELVDQTIAADEYRIYAGGRSIPGSTLGVGGPGGYSWRGYTVSGPGYTQSELDQISTISDAFSDDVVNREEPASEFTSWGGTITFDTDAGTNWHYDWQTQPGGGESDLYSVALHELLHALGFGTSNEWNLIAAGGFDGAASVAEYGGNVPTNGGHWQYDTDSTILRDGDAQETTMDPDLTTGTRKLLTDLDIAGLDDIGWDIDASFTYAAAIDGDTDGDGDVDDSDLGNSFANYTGPIGGAGGKTAAQGDTDGDGDVDDSDLGTSFSNYTGPLTQTNVPEPASAAMLALATLLATRRKHH